MALGLFVKFLKWQDKKLVGVAIHMMKILGRSPKPIHPKHLYDKHRNQEWNLYNFQNKRFLDVGSGNGSEMLRALEAGASIAVGLEKDHDAIELARLRLSGKEEHYQILEIDLEQVTLEFDQKFDFINFTNVLEHIHNRQALLQELTKVLDDDGVMLISIPNKDTTWKKVQRKFGVDSRDDADHKIEYDMQLLSAELEAAGLKLGELHPIVLSAPVNGMIALTAIVSPWIYIKLQALKRNLVKNRLDQSIGWIFFVRK